MDKNGILIKMSASDRTQFGRVAFRDQSEIHQVFSAIWELESQVNNGGFEQYFCNSDGDAVSFAPTALRTIGAKACASIVQRALAVVSTQPLPDDPAERERLVHDLDDAAVGRLNELDGEFFAYPDNLTDLLYEFVSAHPEEFGTVPG